MKNSKILIGIDMKFYDIPSEKNPLLICRYTRYLNTSKP